MSTSHFLSIVRPIIVLSIITFFVGCSGGGGGGTATPKFTLFSISGTVSGSVSSGVTMILKGTNITATVTDSSGNYTFTGLANGSYTVIPSLLGYVFNSVSEAVTINGANITPINFTATTSTNPTYNISGKVTFSVGGALPGVTVTLSGPGSGSAATDESGSYSFTGLTNGSYTVTPSLAGYVFNSVSEAVTINGANITPINFTATTSTNPTYNISGNVTVRGGGALECVIMTLSGTGSGSAATDASGNYTFTGLANGSYTVTPSLAEYTFNPASMAVTINGANVTSNNFTATASSAPTYTISGNVTVSGEALNGVTMTLKGTNITATVTDANGNYTFTGLANGSYIVIPSLAGYTFNPASMAVTINGANATSNNFTNQTCHVGISPYGIAIDGSGNVWVANDGSGNVTELSSTGAVFGTYAVSTDPTVIAIDGSGNVWVANWVSNNVTELSSTGAVLGAYAVGPSWGIAIDGSGNVWVSNMQSNSVTELSSFGSVLGTYPVGTEPYGIAIDGSGNVWVANGGSGNVTKLSSTGSVLGTYAVGIDPTSIVIDGSGNVWVANYGRGNVTKLSSTGAVLGTYTVGTEPWGIAIDGSGNVWVSNMQSNSVTELSSTGAVLGTYTVGTEPWGIAIDGSGNVWVTNWVDNIVTELIGIASPVKTPLVSKLN